MTTNIVSAQTKRTVRLKGIALPNEHGSWGFLFEPLLAGVLIAPSISSIWISLMIIGAFLTRQPLKILLSDLVAKRNLPQTQAALKFVLAYGVIFVTGLIGAVLTTKSESFYPFLFILPFGIFQIYNDVNKSSRQLIPELLSAIAISSSIAVVTLAGGFSNTAAYGLWLVFIARLIPSILYVRNRLLLEKGKSYNKLPVIISNVLAIFVVGYLAFNNIVPKLPLIMFVVLSFRAIWGLSVYRKKVKAMKIGVWEVIYGTLTALSVVVGYYLQI